jgi:hypothetical protein
MNELKAICWWSDEYAIRNENDLRQAARNWTRQGGTVISDRSRKRQAVSRLEHVPEPKPEATDDAPPLDATTTATVETGN